MPSVGGEDRLEAALGSGDRLGLIAVEGAKEELRLVLLLEGLLPGKRREDDQPSVRGEGEGLSIHREVVALRQPDLHAVYWRVLRNCPSADSLRDEGPRESAQDCESSDSTYSIGHGEASPAPLAGPGPRRGPPGLASLGQVETAHPDVAGEVGRRVVSAARVLREEPVADPSDRGGRSRRQLVQRLGLLADDGRERLGSRGSPEGTLPSQHLVENDAEGELVAPEVHGLPTRLLWRHVGHRPEDRPSRGQLVERR